MTSLSLYLCSLLNNNNNKKKLLICYNYLHTHRTPLHLVDRAPQKTRLVRLLDMNVPAVFRGRVTGKVLAQQSGARNYREATMCTSSASGQDMTNWLWSIYNETKKQTEGRACIC